MHAHERAALHGVRINLNRRTSGQGRRGESADSREDGDRAGGPTGKRGLHRPPPRSRSSIEVVPSHEALPCFSGSPPLFLGPEATPRRRMCQGASGRRGCNRGRERRWWRFRSCAAPCDQAFGSSRHRPLLGTRLQRVRRGPERFTRAVGNGERKSGCGRSPDLLRTGRRSVRSPRRRASRSSFPGSVEDCTVPMTVAASARTLTREPMRRLSGSARTRLFRAHSLWE